MTEEDQQKLDEQAVRTFREMAEYALSGRSPHVILITFGPEGKSLMGGDPGALVLALETAKAFIVEDCIRQRGQQREAQAAFFSMPTAGSA